MTLSELWPEILLHCEKHAAGDVWSLLAWPPTLLTASALQNMVALLIEHPWKDISAAVAVLDALGNKLFNSGMRGVQTLAHAVLVRAATAYIRGLVVPPPKVPHMVLHAVLIHLQRTLGSFAALGNLGTLGNLEVCALQLCYGEDEAVKMAVRRLTGVRL